MKTLNCFVILCINVTFALEKNVEPECDVEPDMGPCKAHMRMYYYNVSETECYTFTYGGCEGNGNRFWTEEECLKSCVRRSPVIQPLKDKYKEMTETPPTKDEVEEKEFCKLPPDSGNCKGHFLKYFFNTLTGTCDSFIYGGCLGNENRFADISSCQKTCKRSPPVIKTYMPRPGFERCFLQPGKGSCEGKFRKYFYDPDHKDCGSFFHSGCGGNLNNFESEIQCLKSCANSEKLPQKNVVTI